MSQVQRYAAFTSDPTGGNPAGVVLEADDLDGARMQQIAAEVGYSETAFVLRTGRQAPDFGLRFFSPLAEVAFCGHATIATSVALAESGARGPFRFDTRAGEIRVSTAREAGVMRASLQSVPGHSRPVTSDALRETLGALRWSPDDLHPDYPAHVAFAGNSHLVLAARTRQRLAELHYDFAGLKEISDREGWTTLQLFWHDGDSVFHSRNPFPTGGVVEDPATGAGAAALGAYLREIGRLPRQPSFLIVQGEDMGRPSELSVTVDPRDPRITVSGTAVPMSPAAADGR
ncbi:PhzF family phenazine biosynthesis protein [Micromonospora sp. DT47]|uniref:PhzF family phenazine biosynthesis protein n=1 Tax=Micromonospora sp. DT47 TaxID=3393431 RepID=UPI003CE87E59